MHRNIISVTLNPSIDVTLWTDGMDFDATNRVLEEAREAGGKGINVSRVVQNFGMPNLCLSVVGEDNSDEFAGYLEEESIHYELLKVQGAVRENLTLRHADCTMKINRKGPFLSVVMIGALMALIQSRMNEGDIVMFGGSLPENVAVSDYAELIMAVKQAGARVVIDSDLFTLEDYHRISPWLIKPNIHELRRILPVEDDSDEAVLQAACTLQRAGVENVLVSRGADGILCVNSQTAVKANAPAVEAKSTVGAGDSALAGFLIGTVKEYGVEECVRLASACGSACVMQDGTALATRDLAFSLLDGITVERLPLPQEDTP
ncbi:MAG: 1-phosphofructokinase family hexose kinase [Ruminococcaceae bacterium]|nr:1-phosphofructokinase family hexose kinase [Oscillospiraceae bacterium]